MSSSSRLTSLLFVLALCAVVTSAQENGEDSPPIVTSKPPLFPFQKNIIAHGIVSTLGYLVFLPTGALIARWLRTFNNKWFHAHWFVQTIISGPFVIASFALGHVATSQAESGHYMDIHKQFGLAIFILYWIQVIFGIVIHYWKPRIAPIAGRPIQNYFHAILGLVIIACAFYQVRYGFRVEFPYQSGLAEVANGANIVWWIWVFVIPVAYFGGVALLIRRQYRQERESRGKVHSASSSGENMHMYPQA